MVYLLSEQPATSMANKFLSHETEHSTGLLYKDGMLTKLGPAMDLMVYNQHHCWLLLSSLCLSAANTVNRASNKVMEETYTGQAFRIVFECLRLLAFCLRAALLAKWEEDLKKDKPSEGSKPEASSTMQKPTEQGQELTAQQQEEEKEEEEASQPQSRVVEDQSTHLPFVLEEEEDPLEAASKLPWEEDARIGRMEKTFSTLAIERILGLLVATLPQELSLSRWIQHKADIEVFFAEKLLPALLHITR